MRLLLRGLEHDIDLLPRLRLVLKVQQTRNFSSFKRLSMKQRFSEDIEEAHSLAVSQGKDFYIDPGTGLTVFTALAAERRGKCCGNACRHCPFGHFNVKPAQRRDVWPEKPILLRAKGKKVESTDEKEFLDILFWSGGKDSFMSLLKHEEKQDSTSSSVLFTTFDVLTGIVAEQNVPISEIFDQAIYLGRDLIAVPLSKELDYLSSVIAGIKIAESSKQSNKTRLIFGDLHLRDIKEWRMKNFTSFGYDCIFPLFDVPYRELSTVLFGEHAKALGAKYYFSALNKDIGYKVGDEIDAHVMEKLLTQSAFDAFGELGEFHTIVRFSSRPVLEAKLLKSKE